MALAIETHDLGKQYGALRAVAHLSLRVTEGEIYAFLGLNGAGKTTTIRMLLGMIAPSTGYATLLQTRVRPGRREPWQGVGYLVETPRAYPELSVRENLEVARRLHPGTPPAAVGQMIERLSLGTYADRPAGNLSQGNAQRLGLARALLHRPRLLLLDEPANGLDPAGIVEIRALLLELTREQGVTVFMSSHILAEVARLAQRIGIIHEGRLLQELSIDALERNRRRRLVVRARDLPAAQAALAAAGQPAERLPDGSLALTGALALAGPDEISRLLVTAGAPPTQLNLEEEELEPYFLRLVGAAEAEHMASLADMIWIEARKALRSRMPLWTALASLFVALAIAFLIFVARHPELSQQLGPVSAKANLLAYSAIDWPAYLATYSQVIAAGGLILFTFVVTWIFGREFSDGTVKDWLAVPVPRGGILLAKFIVGAIWSAGLTLVILAGGLVMGALLQLPAGSLAVLLHGAAMVAITSGLVMVVILPLALLASLGRGYLLPLAGMILIVMLINLALILGVGEYFPWSVPLLFSQGKAPLAPVSYVIVLATGLVGMALTGWWWQAADQAR